MVRYFAEGGHANARDVSDGHALYALSNVLHHSNVHSSIHCQEGERKEEEKGIEE